MIEQKSKAPLNLMEQVVMILVFAFAAALCVQAFVLADAMSQEAYARDKAAIISQTMAETIKGKNGSMEKTARFLEGETTENGFLLYYNEDWEKCLEEEAAYRAELAIKESDAYLKKGEIVVKAIEGQEIIFTLPVNWQEVADHE